jgi:hypothetical protein
MRYSNFDTEVVVAQPTTNIKVRKYIFMINVARGAGRHRLSSDQDLPLRRVSR